MDVLRSCKRHKVFWDNAKTKSSEVIWYWAEPGAEFLRSPNLFTSETWDTVHWYCPGAGEDDLSNPTYYNGLNQWGFAGQGKVCGDLSWFAEGCPSDAPPLPRNADGSPACCAVRYVGSGCSCSTHPVPPPPPVVATAKIWIWMFFGDTLTSCDVSVTSGPNTGTSYFAATLVPTSTVNVGPNAFGFDIWEITLTFPGGLTLASGTYYVNLQNALTNNGNIVFFDESGGPSLAYDNFIGAIPSETFQLFDPSSALIDDNSNGFVNAFNVNGYAINFGFIVSNSILIP